MRHWSQAQDQLLRWMWNNNCTAQLQELGQMPTPDNWSADHRWPVASRVIPGNPEDRQLPTFGN